MKAATLGWEMGRNALTQGRVLDLKFKDVGAWWKRMLEVVQIMKDKRQQIRDSILKIG